MNSEKMFPTQHEAKTDVAGHRRFVKTCKCPVCRCDVSTDVYVPIEEAQQPQPEPGHNCACNLTSAPFCAYYREPGGCMLLNGTRCPVQAMFHADEPQPAPAFSPGDVVQLRSGGPAMTVIAIVGELARCRWFVDELGYVEDFPVVALKAVG